MASVYRVNKGVARPITFQGLKGPYIVVLAAGLVALLLGFAIGYMLGLGLIVLLPLVVVLGSLLFAAASRLSRRFGAQGLSKHLAGRRVPRVLKFRSRRLFTTLKY